MLRINHHAIYYASPAKFQIQTEGACTFYHQKTTKEQPSDAQHAAIIQITCTQPMQMPSINAKHERDSVRKRTMQANNAAKLHNAVSQSVIIMEVKCRTNKKPKHSSSSHHQNQQEIVAQQHCPPFRLGPSTISSSSSPTLLGGNPNQLRRLSPYPRRKLPFPSIFPGVRDDVVPSKTVDDRCDELVPASRLLRCSTSFRVMTRNTSSIPSPSLALISWQQSHPISWPQNALLRLLSTPARVLDECPPKPAVAGGVDACVG